MWSPAGLNTPHHFPAIRLYSILIRTGKGGRGGDIVVDIKAGVDVTVAPSLDVKTAVYVGTTGPVGEGVDLKHQPYEVVPEAGLNSTNSR